MGLVLRLWTLGIVELGHPHAQVLNNILQILNLYLRVESFQFYDACQNDKACQTNFLNAK